jgi:hypothetical protein
MRGGHATDGPYKNSDDRVIAILKNEAYSAAWRYTILDCSL